MMLARAPGIRRRKRLKRTLEAALACAALFLAAGCRPASTTAKITVQCEVSPQPARVGHAALAIRLADRDAKAVTGAKLTVEGDMTHPGMAPVFGDAHETTAGKYAGQIEFTMAGDWAILLHVTLPGGQTVDKQVDVRGVRPD